MSKFLQYRIESVDACMQDDKSLCAAVVICDRLVNIQTDRCPHTPS